MQTNNKSSFKRGTIGYTVDKLVAKYGRSTQGIYQLERALQIATGMDTELVQIGGKLTHETPGYVAVKADEAKFYAEVDARIAARNEVAA